MMNRQQAMALLNWAHDLNPGPWREHSLQAARAAEAIARRAGLDPDRAWLSGALHDIGRYEGVRGMHHIIAGHHLMMEKNEPELARICMTHSFPGGDPMSYTGEWDVSDDERAFVLDFIANAEMDDYDRLLQLCDALALPEGVCLIEKRMVNVVLRYGANAYLQGKWRATMEIREDFERRMGCSVYALFDDVIVNTFGLNFVEIQSN